MNGPVTHYGNFTHSLWIHNTVPSYLLSTNIYLLALRIPYLQQLVAFKLDCDMITVFIYRIESDMKTITSNYHPSTENMHQTPYLRLFSEIIWNSEDIFDLWSEAT